MNPLLPTAPAGQMADASASPGRCVLIVDDDPLVSATLAMQMEIDGICVATAATVIAAQAALESNPSISVVVCDVHLANESGFDLAHALGDLRPERLATEIVFITGDATSDTAIEALRHRAFDMIRKPLRRAELVARVDDAHRSAMRRRQRQALLDQIENRLAEGEVQKQRLMTALHDAEGQHRAFEESTTAARRDLLAVISHELKTPLIPIVGLSDIMLSAPDLSPQEVREYAGLIRDGGEQLEAIIGRMLGYLDVENQHAVSDKDAFAVADLIAGALRHLPTAATMPTPEIETECATQLGAWGAKALLTQALHELIDNAIKASPPGGKVQIAAHPDGEACVNVTVSDSGPGLPDLVRKNVGMPFLKGDSSLSRTWHGVGIGLASAKKIAQLSGGDLEFGDVSASSGTQVILSLRQAAM